MAKKRTSQHRSAKRRRRDAKRRSRRGPNRVSVQPAQDIVAQAALTDNDMTVNEQERSMVWIKRRLQAEGRPHGLDALHEMDDATFVEHMQRVHELSDEFDALH